MDKIRKICPPFEYKHEDANGVDVTLIDQMLNLTPKQRLQTFERHMAFVRKMQNAEPTS